jgi:hypothetical protein
LKKTAAIQYNVEKAFRRKAFRPGIEQMSRLEEQRGRGSERKQRDRLSI